MMRDRCKQIWWLTAFILCNVSKQSKVLYIHLIRTPELQNFVCFALWLAVSKIQGCQISEMHRVTPNWTWTLNSQKYLMYTEHLPLRPRFWSISLYDQPFPRYKLYKVGKNRKCNDWPQINLQHLTVKSTLYTLKTYPRGPNVRPFRSTISHFRDTRSRKIGNAPNEPKLNLMTWQSKVLY